MNNPNYIAGRAFEYETIKHWRGMGYSASRTAGSHGSFDVLAFRTDAPIELIQCKRVSTLAEAQRLAKRFRQTTKPSRFFHQTITIKVKGTKIPLTFSV